MLTSSFFDRKWKKRRALRQEMKELDAFFKRTGYPKTPRYYIIKWLTDYIADYGIDGYRADTVKHTELRWPKPKANMHLPLGRKQSNKVLDNNPFTHCQVYNYNISAGKS
jgi:alpha-amylase